MMNEPAPYCMTNDNAILLLLILNLVGISYVLLMNGANIFERAKCIFYYENKSTSSAPLELKADSVYTISIAHKMRRSPICGISDIGILIE